MVFDELALFGLSYAALLIAATSYGVYALRPVTSGPPRDEFFGRVGVGAGVAAATTLFAGLAWRVIRGLEFPLADANLLCLALAFATIVNNLIIERLTGKRKGGSGPMLLALLLETLALFVIPAARPRMAPLGDPWLTIYTAITLWAYGLLAVAAGYGLAALWPSTPQELHEGQDLSMALGVVVLPLGLIVGGWWNWSTWGGYIPASAGLSWGLIVWLICTAILKGSSTLTAISRKTLFLPALGFVLLAVALWAMAVG
jgi:hypothetical protein